MHICYVIWKFSSPKNFTMMGGAERQLLKITKFFASDKNMQITILTKKRKNELKKEVISPNKEIRRIDVAHFRFISMIIFNILLFFQLIRLHKKKPIDLIVIPLPSLFIITIFLIRIILRIPVISRIATIELYPYNRKGIWLVESILIRFFILKMDAIHTLNPKSFNYAKYLGYPTEKLFLIPNGVYIPERSCNYKDFKNNILYIGGMNISPKNQFIDSKNLMFLIKAFEKLLNLKPQLRLVLVGDGNNRPYLEKYVESANLKNKIIFTGYQINIQQYLNEADIFVNPSLHEGMPNTVIEAMGAGVLVLCSNIAEHRFIIKNYENGVLFDYKSEDDFIQQIISIYENPQKKFEIAKIGRNYVIKNFSMNTTIKRLQNMYKKTINSYHKK